MNPPNEATQALTNYFSRFQAILRAIHMNAILDLTEEMKAAKLNGGRIFVCGNGGSAALASHFVTDIGSGSVKRGQYFPIISLVDGSPVITAAANDFGYSHIFSRQLMTLAQASDLLIVISSSGNSQNLIEAVSYAKSIGMRTGGLLGFDGGKLLKLLDAPILVESAVGEYGPIEDSHSCILHAMTELLRGELVND